MARVEYEDWSPGIYDDPTEYIINQPYELYVETWIARQSGDLLDGPGPSYSVEKTGAGTLYLTGEDTDYTGPTLVSAGTLVLAWATTINSISDYTIGPYGTLAFGVDVELAFLGSIAGGGDIDLGPGTYLELDSLSSDHVFSGRMFDDVTGTGSLDICGCGGGSLTIKGSVDIGGKIDIGAGGTLIVDHGFVVTGDGVWLDGLLRIVNRGSVSTTEINGTALEIDGPGSSATASALTAITGRLAVTNGGTIASLDDALLMACGCDGDLATADITGTGSRWDITGSLEMDVPTYTSILTVADGGTASASTSILVGPDSIINIGDGGLAGTVVTPQIVNDGRIVAYFTDASVLGADITGIGALQKTGSGTLTLLGFSDYSGATTVSGGRLNVDGIIESATAVAAGATLGGNGIVASAVNVASGGTLAPGSSVGAITTGDLSLAAGARFEAEIAGTLPGSGYDRVTVNGTVQIAGAELDLSLLDFFEPPFGQSFTIIDNDGSDAVLGTFAGFAEGAVFLVDGRHMTITYKGGDGNDVALSALPPPTVIIGTDGPDLIDATHTVAGQPLPTSFTDLIYGNGGDDVIAALGGNDYVEGGEGDDRIAGDAGNDSLYGGNGADTISGGEGADAIWGGADGDAISGDAGNDTLRGEAGDDVLVGGDGDDMIHGGDGKDTVDAGNGNDTVSGASGDDTLSGGDGDDAVAGEAGDDVVLGGAGRDALSGGDGDDTIFGGSGDDFIWGENGDDAAYGGDGDDIVSGARGEDTLYGDAGNDRLDGGANPDTLFGGLGDDVLTGGKGKNTLYGGEGSDTFVFVAPKAKDKIKDFDADDLIALSRASFKGIGKAGPLKAKYFFVGDEAETRKQKVLYDKDTGWLLYAKKGSATANPHKLVKIGKDLDDFSHHDILVI